MAYWKTLSLRPNFSYMSVFRILIISTFFKIVFPQMVSFHVRDEINNSIVFENEENIALSCERSGFSESAVVRIYKDDTMLQSESDDYTVEAEGNATILTIKVASASTSGLYTCVVMDNTPPVTINSTLNFMVVAMNPQCYSHNIRTENVVVEGGTFQADCFYQDTSPETPTEAIWVKKGKDGSKTEISSNEVRVGIKRRRNIMISNISNNEDGVTYICQYTFFVVNAMRESSCSVGPITVTSKSTTASSSNSVQSTAMSSSSSVAPSTAMSSSSSVVPSTAMSLTTVLTSTAKLQISKEMSNEKDTMSFEDLLIYIIPAGAVLAILLIFVIVCCCCCCRQRRKAESKNTTPSEEPVNPLSIYDTAPFDKSQISGPFYDAPPNGFDKPTQVESSNEYQPSLPPQTFARPESVLIPGTDDMASTHL